MEGQEDEVRFALTSEAGLNDGLAFPFVHLAIALAAASQTGEPWLLKWISVSVIWKIASGIAVGWVLGWCLGWLVFHMPNRAKLSRTGDGFVALGITGMTYGLAEIAGGYGFLAVFVAALAVRAAERGHSYHEKLHDFAEQLERILMMALLVLFGGALSDGGLLRGLTWEAVGFALIALFVIRPLGGWIGFFGVSSGRRAKKPSSRCSASAASARSTISLRLRPRRVREAGAALERHEPTVLISIVSHGATVTPAMRYLDRRAGRVDEEVEQLELALLVRRLGGPTSLSLCRQRAHLLQIGLRTADRPATWRASSGSRSR
jgi:NhaP-type Na+/H+ or K+/H+ antiporter